MARYATGQVTRIFFFKKKDINSHEACRTMDCGEAVGLLLPRGLLRSIVRRGHIPNSKGLQTACRIYLDCVGCFKVDPAG